MTCKPLAVTVAALLGFALLPPVAAQSLYKSTMPDGRVRYGDAPAPGAMKVEEIQTDTPKEEPAGTAARERQALKDLEKERQQRESGVAVMSKAPSVSREYSRASVSRSNSSRPILTGCCAASALTRETSLSGL